MGLSGGGATAQPSLQDGQWIFSNKCERDANGKARFAATRLSFSEGERLIFKDTTTNHQIHGANVTISDVEGKLLWYSNGCEIINRYHQTMENGDSINYNAYWEWIDNCNIGYLGRQNHLILDDPAKEDGYYLIHKPIDYGPDGGYMHELRYSYVSMETDSGRVVEKNVVAGKHDTTLYSYLTAIRKENNTDWWITFLQGAPYNRILAYDLTDSGLAFNHSHETEFSMPRNGYSSSGMAKYSPDGRTYAFYNPKGGLHVYDFDRSDGAVSNLRRASVETNDRFGFIEFSANSRFIYFSVADTLWQADLDMPDLQESIVMIDEWDGFATFSPTMFQLMQRGPDCKIYMSSLNTTPYLHVINNPDEKGAACNFVQRDIEMFCSPGSRSMPNFPQFNVGAKEEVCNESLTTWVEEVFDSQYSLTARPNPVSDLLIIDAGGTNIQEAQLRDMQGRLLYKREVHDVEVELDVGLYEAGIYLLSIRTEEGHVMTELVSIR